MKKGRVVEEILSQLYRRSNRQTGVTALLLPTACSSFFKRIGSILNFAAAISAESKPKKLVLVSCPYRVM